MLPLVLLWLVPLVVFLWVHDEPYALEQDALSAVGNFPVEVGSRTQDLRQAATIRLEVNDGMQLGSSASGTVTAVFVREGDVLSNGTPILSVDSAPVFAQVGGTPLYRDLSSGTSGPDVAALNCMLATLGGTTDCDDPVFGSKTSVEVRNMQRFFGLKPDGVFRTTYSTYLGIEGSIVDHIVVAVGERIDGSDAFLSTPNTVADVVITLDGPPGGIQDKVSNTGLVLSDGVDDFLIPGFDIPESLWTETQRFLDLSRDRGRTREDPAGTFAGLSVRLAEPVQVGTVPASSVLTDATGRSCLVSSRNRPSTTPNEYTTLPLSDLMQASSEIGVANVPFEYAGLSIWSAPNSLPESADIRCS